LAFDVFQIHRRRLFRFVLVAALAACVGCADILATESASTDVGGSQLTRAQSQFRLTSGLLPAQFCRFIPCRSSARMIEVTEEEQEKSDANSPRPALGKRPNSQTFASEILSFRIVAPDRLIELPGTPPPAARC
jgi:hypothetical protein